MRNPTKLTPEDVPCQTCAASIRQSCQPVSSHPMGPDLLHYERVQLAIARNRMAERQRTAAQLAVVRHWAPAVMLGTGAAALASAIALAPGSQSIILAIGAMVLAVGAVVLSGRMPR